MAAMEVDTEGEGGTHAAVHPVSRQSFSWSFLVFEFALFFSSPSLTYPHLPLSYLFQLAIVHMSDQYTRVKTGGSKLTQSSAVSGLLFGTLDGDGVLQIVDADEVPLIVPTNSDNSKEDQETTMDLQIELHQAVFPRHRVVGWYRVSTEDEPTATDLQVTQQLVAKFPQQQPFVFLLLQVSTSSSSNNNNAKKESGSGGITEDLPISLYELQTSPSAVLLNLDDQHWNLETGDEERIAVERVMRERPKHTSGDEGSATSSEFLAQQTSIQHSVTSMMERIDFLIEFLQKIESGAVTSPDEALIRDCQALILSLGPLSAETKEVSGYQDAILVSHLAALAKTTSAVQSYTDKFRVLHDNRTSTLGKDMRRNF